LWSPLHLQQYGFGVSKWFGVYHSISGYQALQRSIMFVLVVLNSIQRHADTQIDTCITDTIRFTNTDSDHAEARNTIITFPDSTDASSSDAMMTRECFDSINFGPIAVRSTDTEGVPPFQRD